MMSNAYNKSRLMGLGLLSSKQEKSNVLYYIFKDEELVYVGITNNFEYRRKSHFTKLNEAKSYNKVLYRAMRKYGRDRFSMYIFHQGDDRNELALKEVEEIKALSELGLCRYNIVHRISGERDEFKRAKYTRKVVKYDKSIADLESRIKHIEDYLQISNNIEENDFNVHERSANYILGAKDIDTHRKIEYSFFMDEYDYTLPEKRAGVELIDFRGYQPFYKIRVTKEEFYKLPMHERINLFIEFIEESAPDRYIMDHEPTYVLSKDVMETIYDRLDDIGEPVASRIISYLMTPGTHYTTEWLDEFIMEGLPPAMRDKSLRFIFEPMIEKLFSEEGVNW